MYYLRFLLFPKNWSTNISATPIANASQLNVTNVIGGCGVVNVVGPIIIE